jgi:hypothetical protein
MRSQIVINNKKLSVAQKSFILTKVIRFNISRQKDINFSSSRCSLILG